MSDDGNALFSKEEYFACLKEVIDKDNEAAEQNDEDCTEMDKYLKEFRQFLGEILFLSFLALRKLDRRYFVATEIALRTAFDCKEKALNLSYIILQSVNIYWENQESAAKYLQLYTEQLKEESS